MESFFSILKLNLFSCTSKGYKSESLYCYLRTNYVDTYKNFCHSIKRYYGGCFLVDLYRLISTERGKVLCWTNGSISRKYQNQRECTHTHTVYRKITLKSEYISWRGLNKLHWWNFGEKIHKKVALIPASKSMWIWRERLATSNSLIDYD